MAAAKLDGSAIARSQQIIFAAIAAIPDRPDGMDHMLGWQPIAFGDFSVACVATMQLAAFDQKLRPGRAVYRSVNATPAQKRGVGGVDDRIDA